MEWTFFYFDEKLVFSESQRTSLTYCSCQCMLQKKIKDIFQIQNINLLSMSLRTPLTKPLKTAGVFKTVYRIPLISLFDSKQVVGIAQIQFGEDSCTVQKLKDRVSKWKWNLMNQSVQQPIILVQSEGDCFNGWQARGPQGADQWNIHRENEEEGKGIVIY